MKCLACNKDLNKKEVVYTEHKQPYCINPFTCNENHPNSPENIVSRGGAVKLYSAEELETNLFERIQLTNEMKDRIIKMATKPQSIRLSKYDIAYHLIRLQETKNLASISEAVRYCVHLAMIMEPIEEPVEEQEPVEPVVVSNLPDVTVQKASIKYEPKEAKEEEFTF